MKNIYKWVFLLLCISCSQENNNIFDDLTIRGGVIKFTEVPNLVHDLTGDNNFVLQETIEDTNGTALSYSLHIEIDDETLTESLVTINSFPSAIEVSRQSVLDALGIANAADLPTRVRFIGVVTTPTGVYSGQSVNFNDILNTQSGGNSADNIHEIPLTALNFVIVMFQQFAPNTLVTVPVSTANDDVEEVVISDGAPVGTMDLGSSDLELGEFSGGQGLMDIGLRFNLIGIPGGATITSAVIQFTADNTGSNPVELTIYGQNTGDAEAFESTNGNLSGRTLTSNSAIWDVPEWVNSGDKGSAQQSVDFSNVLQEIIDRSDWVPGNNIVIILKQSGVSLNATSSSGGREAETAPSDEPELILSYTN